MNAKQDLENAKFAARNRDRALGFDGRYGGSSNLGSNGNKIAARLCYDEKKSAEWVRL